MIAALTPDDAEWAAALMERRRQEYERYSPVFWRPAQGVTGVHARFLRRQLGAEQTIALRTPRAFIICQCRPGEGFVDDFTVESPGTWDDDGAALLRAAAERLAARGIGSVRVVTAHADQVKTALLSGLSLVLAEQWWVRELTPAAEPRAPGRVGGPGFSGLVTSAPPVYDPGGPVFLADRAAPEATPGHIVRTAAAHGAVLAILPAAPGTGRAAELRESGWSVASDWYAGWPRPD